MTVRRTVLAVSAAIVTDDDRLRALAATRPGMCTYPVMLRQATPPVQRGTVPRATPAPDLPNVTRWRWWHRWTARR